MTVLDLHGNTLSDLFPHGNATTLKVRDSLFSFRILASRGLPNTSSILAPVFGFACEQHFGCATSLDWIKTQFDVP
jgi:hypothetical protein